MAESHVAERHFFYGGAPLSRRRNLAATFYSVSIKAAQRGRRDISRPTFGYFREVSRSSLRVFAKRAGSGIGEPSASSA